MALQEVLVELTRRLVQGRPAPQPYPYDPRNGVTANAAPFPLGAASATVARQHGPEAWRLGSPRFAWRGGVRGFDRPLERPFVQIQRRTASGGWRTVDSDLGLAVLWRVNEDGLYLARWEPRLDQPLGAYRFRITANRYALTSSPFELSPNKGAPAATRRGAAGKVAVVLDYPRARVREEIGDPVPGREREPHPPPAQRRLGPGDLHRRRPADHRAGRTRRPLRGQREPRRPDPDPGRRRPRRLRQPHRPGFRLSGLSFTLARLSGARPGRGHAQCRLPDADGGSNGAISQ